jgi:GDP-D-mannose dehydratase
VLLIANKRVAYAVIDSDTPEAVIVRINPRYLRPAEAQALLGDPTKAKQNYAGLLRLQCKECV